MVFLKFLLMVFEPPIVGLGFWLLKGFDKKVASQIGISFCLVQFHILTLIKTALAVFIAME